MPNYRQKLAAIAWGAAFANTLNVGYWLDDVTAGDEPRAGSEQLQSPAGSEDAWTVGTDYVLQCKVRWIPQSNTSSPLATGWDGSTGFRAFLQWARDKNAFKFYPDVSDLTTHIDNCYLVEPMTGQGAFEADGTRVVQLKIRNASTPFDGY